MATYNYWKVMMGEKMIENAQNSRWKFIIVVLFTTVLFLTSLVLFVVNNQINKDTLILMEQDRIEEHYRNVLNRYFDKLNQIEVFYLTTGPDNLNNTNFNAFGDISDFEGIGFVSFSIAPEGIMQYYYSYEYGDSLIGLDLIHDERDHVREAVEYAIENNVVVINGPFTLLQGGNGLVFRKPVFIEDEFMGLINLVVHYEVLNDLLNESNNEIVDVGIYNTDNELIFGNLEYSSDLSFSDALKSSGTDWLIGSEVSSSYSTRIIRTSILIISIALTLYIIALIVLSRFYRRITNLLVDKDYLIYYDKLTLLPNRRMLSHDINSSIRDGEVFYLGFGDLDNFKNLNDIMGHSIGDQYLKNIAERFITMVSPTLKIYRWGGDEFIFLIKQKDKSKVIETMNAIYNQFDSPITMQDTDYNVSISIGIVSFPENGDNVDSLIRRADIVMYDVKSQTNNDYGFFEDKYLADLTKRVDFENKVNRHSLEDFLVYLQPIVKTECGDIEGFEGLIRLFDDDELLNTYDVVKLYERKGEIAKIDKLVFERVCEYHVMFKQLYDKEYKFSFNISPLTLSDDFVEYAQRLITENSVQASHFIIEIIETLGFKDMKDSLRLLTKLRNLGFHIAMDDFGMGYSSLSYITKLPLSMIKIDRTFINNYRTNEFDRLLILTIKDISLSLNIDIIVEGIETKEQLDYIKQIGAKYYQGYFHSRPVSVEDTIIYLNRITK